jgi:peptide chain release factor 3
MSDLKREIERRRTFAIISHPDAGKTTLTEKLLLFGGAIQLAGAVKARGDARRARSDWMKVEQERGISVTTSAMSFEYAGCAFNLLDTPGHQDFSEDTYRTLSAVDSAVMVLDAAKGIESQTRKLFEVCRLRDVPILTFVNKLDREGRDTFSLLDEVEQSLALEVTPASWPIGMGTDFLGCYDLLHDRLILMARTKGRTLTEGVACDGLDDPKLDELLPARSVKQLREEVEMVRGLCPPLDHQAFLEGHRTPVFFGSALNNFGVREILQGLVELAPPPRSQPTATRRVEPDEPKVSAFVFKIQANMDPRHHDRIAFMRLCSGHFKRGMRLTQVRTGADLFVRTPLQFLAQDRELADEAFAGDILGVPNHGKLRIGDTLTEGEALRFTGIPSFAPEMLKRVRPEDPLRVKHLGRALMQLAEEGVARVFKQQVGGQWIVGVVGALQFEIIADRIRTEFNVPVQFEPVNLQTARWIEADDPAEVQRFLNANQGDAAEDHTGAPVFLARNDWHIERTGKDWPKLRFQKTREPT